MSSKRDERWRDAALTGRFDKLRDVVTEMVGQNWPKHEGHIYMREYGKPGEQSEDKDRRMYADFAANLYARKYFSGAPEQIPEHKAAISKIAADHYDAQVKADYPVTAEGAQAAGVQIGQQFNYFVPKDGKQEQRFYQVSMLNIGAHNCGHCATNTAAKTAKPGNCDIVSPDDVFKDRMDYFNTTMHELAHSVRELNGQLKYGDPKAQRREENIALVFAGLMQAKVFGPAGMLGLRMDTIKKYGSDSSEENVRYESVGPMLAALAYVDDKQQEGLAKLSPAALLRASVKLVDSNDLTKGMTPEQEKAFGDFLKHMDRTPEIAGKRMRNLTKPTEEGEGPTRHFTLIAKKPEGGYEILYDRTPYLPQMAAVDKAFERYGTLNDSLREMQMRLNPLRPAAMARDVYQTSDPSGFEDPQWQAALFDFNKGFNNKSCDIPAVFRQQMKDLDDVRREVQAADAAKNAPEGVTVPASISTDVGDEPNQTPDADGKQQARKPIAPGSAAPGSGAP